MLHAFSGNDGVDPIGTLVFDVEGNLYGATSYIGEHYGMVFETLPWYWGEVDAGDAACLFRQDR